MTPILHIRSNKARNHLKPVWREISEAWHDSDAVLQQYLPLESVTYTAWYFGWMRWPVGGAACGRHHISMSFNPQAKDFSKELFPKLVLYGAHERNHIKRHRGAQDGSWRTWTVGDVLVSEGLATATEFEIAARYKINNPYPYKRDDAYIIRSLVEVDGRLFDLAKVDKKTMDWLNDIDPYSLGHHIVQTYQRLNGNPSVRQMMHVPVKKILAATFG